MNVHIFLDIFNVILYSKLQSFLIPTGGSICGDKYAHAIEKSPTSNRCYFNTDKFDIDALCLPGIHLDKTVSIDINNRCVIGQPAKNGKAMCLPLHAFHASKKDFRYKCNAQKQRFNRSPYSLHCVAFLCDHLHFFLYI